MDEYYENQYLCCCGAVPGRNGMLCANCEKELLLKIDSCFDDEEIAYLKEIYYLSP